MDPLFHYLRHGIAEGRKAPDGFNKGILDLVYRGDASAKTVRELQLKSLATSRSPDVELDETATRDNLGEGFPLPVGEVIVAGIVLYNNDAEEIRRLLRSIRRSKNIDGVGVSLIAINNGEPLESQLQAVLNEYSVDMLENLDGNIGSSAGHSRLMRRAFEGLGAVAYMTLNPDGFFHPRALERMVRMAHRHQWGAAIEAAQLPNENGKYFNPDTFDTEWAVTACALFPRRIWEKVGGFDPNIFLYCDDVDYGWEIRRAGFKVKYCPWAYYFHDYASRTAVSEFFRKNRLEAGRYLGHKWGNPAFRHMCETQLVELGFYGGLEEMPKIDDINPLPHSTDVANFRNEFYFAERRW
ncbi:hypothetical protein ASD02_32240 [Ensifer sp. Root1252]|nr:hypothetical protein ASD02_32240 [Ensifer sp. Root1252]KRC54254.1 hypothetical protein ASE32_22290 [Ensifer sp. Root231]KRD01588.1 hypothetical protein ASE47_21665 [Ensifer sp. Root258]